MSAHTPNTLVTLRRQPLMSKILCIKIMHLKTAMMNMRRLVRAHEKGVVVYQVLPAIDMTENRNILDTSRLGRSTLCSFGILRTTTLVRNIQNIRRHEIEMLRIPVHLRRKVLHTQPIVTQFMHSRRSGLEALKLANSWRSENVIHNQFRGQLTEFCWRLPKDQIDRKPFWIGQAKEVATTRSVGYLLNLAGIR